MSRLNQEGEIPSSPAPPVALSVTTPSVTIQPEPPATNFDRAAWSRLMRESRENLRLGKLDEAAQTLLAALLIGNHHGPPDQRTQTTLFYLEQIADTYYTSGRYSQHAQLTPQFVLAVEAVRGAADPSVAAHRLSLARSFEQTGQVQSARAILDSLLVGPPPPTGMERASLLLRRASILVRTAEAPAPDQSPEERTAQRRQDLTEAEANIDEAFGLLDESAEADPLLRLAGLQLKANILIDQGRTQAAERLLIEALAVAQLNAPASISEATTQRELAEFYMQQNRQSEALAYAKAASDQLAASNAPAEARLAALDLLATILIALNRDEEAEAAFERGLAFAEEYPEAAKTLKDHHETWQQGSEQNKAAEKMKSPPPAAPASPPVQTSLSAPEQ